MKIIPVENLAEAEKIYKDEKAWGLSTALDLHGCNPNTIKDANKVEQHVIELCELLGVKPYGECKIEHFADHNEEVAGFSMMQFIETSSIIGCGLANEEVAFDKMCSHYANASNRVFFDIFSCKFYPPKVAQKFTEKFFEAEGSDIIVILRGNRIPPRKI